MAYGLTRHPSLVSLDSGTSILLYISCSFTYQANAPCLFPVHHTFTCTHTLPRGSVTNALSQGSLHPSDCTVCLALLEIYTHIHILNAHTFTLQYSSLKYIMQRALSNIHSLMTSASRKKETHGTEMSLKALHLCLSQYLTHFIFYLCAYIRVKTNNQ